jgi:large subunit ribosomal protein L32
MPVPKRKRSRARRDSRFANKGLKVKSFAGCAQCSEPILPHQACKNCGFYKGKKVVATKIERAVKRGEARQVQAAKQAKSETAPAE